MEKEDFRTIDDAIRSSYRKKAIALIKKGVKIIGLKLMKINEELAKQHYAVHNGKIFFNDFF